MAFPLPIELPSGISLTVLFYIKEDGLRVHILHFQPLAEWTLITPNIRKLLIEFLVSREDSIALTAVLQIWAAALLATLAQPFVLPIVAVKCAAAT